MKILNQRILRGPNYWSVTRKHLIQLLVDLELSAEAAHKAALSLPQQLHPVLVPEVPGGTAADRDTLAAMVASTALGLQQAAGITTENFYALRPTTRAGVFQVVYSYAEKEAGAFAGEAAVQWINALLSGEEYNPQPDIERLRSLWNREKLGPSTHSVVAEALKRNIPVLNVEEGGYIQFGHGARQRRIQATIASTTSSIAVDIAGDKDTTKKLLTAAGLPAPRGVVIRHVDKLDAALDATGFPLVVKPLNANQGKGATTNISTRAEAAAAFALAQQFSQAVIIEKFITGFDFRALVVNHRFVAAAMRTPASVTGDGQHTIRELVDITNADPKRGNGHESVLTAIRLDESTGEILAKNGYTPDTVLPAGKELWLKSTANLSTGGTATDVTDRVHPANIALFERAARVVGLDICGIDVMATDLETPIRENGGAIIEINAAPGLRMHLEPTTGQPRNVARPIMDMLFPKGNGRIPLVAVTGTNGKTTTTRLIAHMAQQAGFTTGYTTTDGIYINKELLSSGDCSGPQSGQVILKDSTVDFAVLETARGGILRAGLCFDQCNCAVVTNVAEDHLGLNEINTLEELAQVKSVVPQTVFPFGYAVLNADDDLVYAMRDRVNCNVALFSLYPDNIRIQRHCENGGLAAYCEDGYLVLQTGQKMVPIDEVKNVPITFSGKAEFNIANALAACLAAYVNKISISAIRQALQSFVPSGEATPGRVNLFQFPDFTVLLDYAHNPHGLRALGKLIRSFEAATKVGVIAGVGDRRDEDITALGEEAARIFDQIIIRFDRDLRGRTADELCNLLRKGIDRVDANKPVLCQSGELEAVHYILNNSVSNSFVTFLSDDVKSVHQQIKQYHDAVVNAMRAAV